MRTKNSEGISEEGRGELEGKVVSRREFLRIAGIAGATICIGAVLGGLLAACGSSTSTTTTSPGTTAAASATSTAVTTSAQMGLEIKIWFVTPLTGPYAAAAVPYKYMVGRWKEFIGDGQVLGDGLKHPITFQIVDSQSTSDRASQVAGDLINNAKVDMMLGTAGPDTVIAV